ncbi:MAG: hypothetical protein K0Q72_499 [Armatimonadetes bacterium]|jgi:hypothetical protein|nr:hypothetical protein [Armatimonadota bacterium]
MSQSELDPVLVTPLRRPTKRASAKRPPGPDRARPIVVKTATGIIVAAIVFASAGRAMQFAIEPLVAIHRTGQEIKDLRGDRNRRLSENEQLRADIAYLNSSAGIEQEARRRGWVRPGEVALSIVVPDAPPETVAATKATKPLQTASSDRGSVADRIRAAVDTCLAVFSGPRTR